jgi:transposase
LPRPSIDVKTRCQQLGFSILILTLRRRADCRAATLFAAIELAEGKIIAECMPRHRHQEWIKFLKKIDAETPPELDLHLIVDNYATHKHPKVQNWLKRHKRFHIHFIPTSSSWLNVIERWFRDITCNRIRNGVFRSVEQLEQAIRITLIITTQTQRHSSGPRRQKTFWKK